MTHAQIIEAARAELTDLMASRKSNPAMTLGHAFKILKLLEAADREHDRALWCMQRELEIERFCNDSPANNAVVRLLNKHE